MAAPSTAWREQVAPDEDERFAGYAQQFTAMQRAKSAAFGNGRALHRKQHLGLKARLEVLDGLPEHARQGLFAAPRRFEAWVRLSNGSANKAANAKPDVRGFAFKVRGVSGPGALGGGDTDCQDFTLIQPPAFAFARTEEFVGLALNGSKGPLPLLKYLLGRYGLFGGLGQARRLASSLGKPFHGFAVESFHTAAPLACGPYAVRMRLRPSGAAPPPAKGSDWALDMADRLRAGPLRYEVQLQFFTDEATTPIEDASVDWPESAAPYLTVATLTLTAQDADGAVGRKLAETIESARFDPWAALMAHRPLGEVMRARKRVYFESQRERGAV